MRFWQKRKLLRGGYPRPPIKIREVALWREGDCVSIFPADEPEKHRDWGVLYVEDNAGQHWSITGEPDFLESRIVPGSERPDSLSHYDVNFQADIDFADYDDLDEFKAQWILFGWPDEWREIGAIYVLPSNGVVKAKWLTRQISRLRR